MSPILSRLGGAFGFGRKNASTGDTTVWSTFSSTQAFSYTGGDQQWTVPTGTSKVGFFIWGAAGASSPSPGSGDYGIGGAGGYTEGVITVSAGEVLWVVVGQGGVIGNTSPRTYGGGGSGGHTNRAANEWGVSGGGLSGIFAAPGPVSEPSTSGTTFPSPSIAKALAIAGGGGGYGLDGKFRNTPGGGPPVWSGKGAVIPAPLGGWMWPGGPTNAQAPYAIDPTGVTFTDFYHGTGGGGLRGENQGANQYAGHPGPTDWGIRGPTDPSGAPYTSPGPVAGGGSQSAGGYGVDGSADGSDGAALSGGNAANAGYEYAGGGGGGGWYGGGGGGAEWPSAYGSGGAGSGYIGNTALTISDQDNTWTGPSPNGRDYELAYTRCATRLTDTTEIYDNGVPAYSSPNSSPFMPTTAGLAKCAPDWAAGNPGYIVIRY